MYGADYLTYCITRIQQWQECWAEKTAERIQITDFDTWLSA